MADDSNQFDERQARIRAFQQKQDEEDARAERIKNDHSPEIDKRLQAHGVEDEETRVKAADFVARNIAQRGVEFSQVSDQDFPRIVEDSIKQATSAEPLQAEKETPQTMDEILAQAEEDVQAEKDIKAEWKRSAQQTLTRGGR